MSAPSLSTSARPVSQRTREIRRILDARYSLSFFEECKRGDPYWWSSSRNEVGRGIYESAMRTQQRLEAASDGELDDELDAI
ncbi:MAG TPA: hypothetical protein VFB08_08950 [Burkholderiales bacterium]|nr:hypothetical protein [Burkholderiales bacterium]